MVLSSIKAVIPRNVERVWEAVTAVERYSWRSDLSKTEILSSTKFVEYTKNGYPTYFTITEIKPCRRWELEIENSNMQGHWIGIFSEKGCKTEIGFTEQIIVKKLFLRPFIKGYLRKQQVQFVTDLKRYLS